MPSRKLNVAVIGATGPAGRGLIPFFEQDRNVRRVVGIDSRPWQPRSEGLLKLDYRQAAPRDEHLLRAALRGSDVAIQLAPWPSVLDAAAAAGARRFIRFLVAEAHDARAEGDLLEQLRRTPKLEWVVFRSCPVAGPHALPAVGGALPQPLADAAGAFVTIAAAAGLRPAVPAPPHELRLVHERDVGQAIHRAIASSRTGVVYDLAGDGSVTPAEAPGLLGLRTLPLPGAASRAVFGWAARLAGDSPAGAMLRSAPHPLVLDTARTKRDLGWRPQFSSRDALAATRRALAI